MTTASTQAESFGSLESAGIRVQNYRMDDVSFGSIRIDGKEEDCLTVCAQDYLAAYIPLVDVAKYLLQFAPEVLARAQAEIDAGQGLAPDIPASPDI